MQALLEAEVSVNRSASTAAYWRETGAISANTLPAGAKQSDFARDTVKVLKKHRIAPSYGFINADKLERKAVAEAIAQGWSWSQVADALGVSKQAAHKRLAPSIQS